MLERAVGLDPDYAPAWTALGQRYLYESQYGRTVRRPRSFWSAPRRLRSAPSRSTRTYGGRGRSHPSADGTAATTTGPMRGPEISCAGGRKNGRAHFVLAYVLRYAGLLEEAMRECDAALAADPHNRSLRSCGNAFELSGKTERARAFYRLDAGSNWSRMYEGSTLLWEKKLDEAARAYAAAGEAGIAKLLLQRERPRSRSPRGESRSRRASGPRLRAAHFESADLSGRRVFPRQAFASSECRRGKLFRLPVDGRESLLRYDPQRPRVRGDPRQGDPKAEGVPRASGQSRDRSDRHSLPHPRRSSAAAAWASSTRPRTCKLGRRVALKFLPDELGQRPAGARAASSARPAPPPRSTTPTSARSTTSTSTTAGPSSRWSCSRARRCATGSGPGRCRSTTLLDLGDPDRRRPRGRARAGHRPPRHQAGQHLRHDARPGQAARLRPGQAARSRRGAAGDSRAADRDGRDEHLTSPGTAHRHRRLHVAGAGAGRGARRAHRPLLLRRRALRDGDGPAALRGQARRRSSSTRS